MHFKLNKFFQFLLFLVTLILFNIIFLCQPFIFQKIYPLVTAQDHFGWTVEEQQRPAVVILDQLNSGTPFKQLTPSEASHMNDVAKIMKATRFIFSVLFIMILLFFLKNRFEKPLANSTVRRFFKQVVIIYTFISIGVGTAVFTLWSFFFDTFHKFLFPKGSWLFPPNSTLIRLFPDIFWQKTFLLLLFLPLSECVLLFVVSTSIVRKHQSGGDTITP